MKPTRIILAALLLASASPAQTTAPAAGDAFDQQATAIVRPLRFSDADRTERVATLTAGYIRQLTALLDQRAKALAAAGQAEAAEVDHMVTEAYRVCRQSTLALRDSYVARLNADLPPALVDRVKDGLTHQWMHRTLQVYDEMIPDLTHVQRAHVGGLLVEMRENAMMELGEGPQEKWVHKYRGIINNYVAREGHDFTTLSKAYDAKRAKRPEGPR